MRRRGEPGRVARKLVELIEAQGFKNVHVTAVQGYWRTDTRADVYRWEGTGETSDATRLPVGFAVRFASWCTMTECVRHGIVVVPDEGPVKSATFFEIYPIARRE